MPGYNFGSQSGRVGAKCGAAPGKCGEVVRTCTHRRVTSHTSLNALNTCTARIVRTDLLCTDRVYGIILVLVNVAGNGLPLDGHTTEVLSPLPTISNREIDPPHEPCSMPALLLVLYCIPLPRRWLGRRSTHVRHLDLSHPAHVTSSSRFGTLGSWVVTVFSRASGTGSSALRSDVVSAL